MTDTPQLRDRIAEIRAEFERTTRPEWRDVHPTGLLLAEIDRCRATIRRLNHRAQRAESRVAAIARAVREWKFTERGTYMPLRSLAAIARMVGRSVPDGRFELHYQRVERLERELATARAVGMREAAAMLRRYCPTHGAEDTCLMDCHCVGADEIDRDARKIAPPSPTPQSAACPCRAPGQDGDGRVRYQARDGEFVNLPCRDHEEG